jgi:hypothetical protein
MRSKTVTLTPALTITLPCSDTELSFGLEVLISHSPTSAYHEFDMGWSCFFTFLFGVSKNTRHKSSEQYHLYERTWCFCYWSLEHSTLTAQECMYACHTKGNNNKIQPVPIVSNKIYKTETNSDIKAHFSKTHLGTLHYETVCTKMSSP